MLALIFGVVDVGRNDGASTGNFVAYKFRGDDFWNRCAKTFAVMLGFQEFGKIFDFLILTDGDVFHLWCDDPLARVVHLRYVMPGLGATGCAQQVEAKFSQFRVGQT